MLWKNTLICAVLKDQYEESEIYKPICKRVYQLNLQKKAFVLCKWIWGNKLSLSSFINDGNDAVMKRSFPPNFQACDISTKKNLLQNLTRFHGGCFEFEIPESFTRAFLLKTIIWTWIFFKHCRLLSLKTK